MSIDIEKIAHHYVAVWNEPDATSRPRAIEALFAPDLEHVMKSLEAHGYTEMEQRVVRSHEKWVRDAGYRFAVVGYADGHHDAVRIRWHMAPTAGGATVSSDSNFLLLGPDDRVRLDYQFIDQTIQK